jgi:hypothetical protein
MRTAGRVGMVAAGYAGAVLVARAAVALYIARTNGPDRQTYGAMYDFGDSIVFLAVLALAAVPATCGAFLFLRSHRAFWRVLSTGALAVAATALASSIIYAGGRMAGAGPVVAWAGFAVLRLLVAPFLAAASFLSGIFAPTRRFRSALFLAGVVEAAAFASVMLVWRQHS